MMKLSKLLLGLMAGALLISASAARADALDDIQKAGVLRVAVPQDFPPFGSVTSDLKPQGLDIDVATLIAKTIGVTRGSVEDLELTKIAPSGVTIKRYEDNNGTISSFLSNQVQLVATGNVIAAAIIAKNPPKKPETKFLIKDSPCFIGLNKDEKKLLDKVNAILAEIKKDGELSALTVKWLGLPLPANV